MRRRLGIPTIFNRLGPLSNPARVRFQVSGAVDLPSAAATARALRSLGLLRGITMTSDDGCDEFSPNAPTTAIAWNPAGSRRLRLRPADLLPADDRLGGWGPLTPPAAAEETERLLAGGGGARRGSILLTSGAALWVAGISPSIRLGVDRARDALDTGAAEKVLAQLRTLASKYPRNQEG